MIAEYFADPDETRPFGRYIRPTLFDRHRWLFATVVAASAATYGYAFAVYGDWVMPLFALPILILAGAVLWLLPALSNPPLTLMSRLFWVYLVGLLCWPAYIALDVPPLPWITVERVTLFPLCILLLISLHSPDFREQLAERFKATPAVQWLVLAVMVCAAASIALSADSFRSVNRFVVLLLGCGATFVVSTYVLSKPGAPQRFAYALWGCALFVCAIGLYEVRFEIVPWANRIPSFLAIQDSHVIGILEGSRRAATGIYRVQAKFSGSIGLGEFLGMAAPFILHIVMTPRRFWVRLAAAATLLLILYIDLKTDSRLAVVAFMGGILLYGLLFGWSRWLKHKDSLIGPAISLTYPAVLSAFIVLSIFWRRLERIIWGGGAEAASTEGRRVQWEIGKGLFAQNPLGHGIGQGASTLGYIAPGFDIYTIDSYYLSILLEFGAQGAVIYAGLFGLAIGLAAWRGVNSRNPEVSWLEPAAVSLSMFVLSKSIYSQEENHPLAFILLGLVVALLWRAKGDVQVEPLAQSNAGNVRRLVPPHDR